MATEAKGKSEAALSELDGLEVEKEEIEKPRVGYKVSVKLPFEYSVSFFFPKRAKEEEKSALSALFASLKKERGDTIDSKLDYLEEVYKAQQAGKDVCKMLLEYKAFSDDVLTRFLEKKTSGTGAKVSVEGDAVKFTVQDRFILFRDRNATSHIRENEFFNISYDAKTDNAVLHSAAKAKSKEEILCVEDSFFVIDKANWQTA